MRAGVGGVRWELHYGNGRCREGKLQLVGIKVGTGARCREARLDDAVIFSMDRWVQL